jgi:hypothetical protein
LLSLAYSINHPLCPKPCKKIFSPDSEEASMNITRAELLDTASMKLAEVVLLLMEAGEKRLAWEAGELARQVEASTMISQIATSTSH